jgi:hypothetical protein
VGPVRGLRGDHQPCVLQGLRHDDVWCHEHAAHMRRAR